MIEEIHVKIEQLLSDLGFNRATINAKQLFQQGQSYYKITFIEQFDGFIIEYAENKQEAEKELFADGDIYPLALREKLLSKLKSDLLEFYME